MHLLFSFHEWKGSENSSLVFKLCRKMAELLHQDYVSHVLNMYALSLWSVQVIVCYLQTMMLLVFSYPTVVYG